MADIIMVDYENKEVSSFLNSWHFCGITYDVGWGCKNHWADVMLIQYMTSKAWAGVDVLVCDGIFGPKTARWIREMQEGYRLVKVDGRIKAIDGTRLRSTISNTVYTMLAINAEFNKHMPHVYKNIKSDENMPDELRKNLFVKTKGIAPKYRGVQTMVN